MLDHPTLIQRLHHHARNTPAHCAIASGGGNINYLQLANAVAAQCAALEAQGIAAGQRVGILCADEVEHLVLCTAASAVGAASCTIPSFETEERQKALIGRYGVSRVLTSEAMIDLSQVADLPHLDLVDRAEIDGQFLFSTSGTTGEPKLVVHHASDLVAQAHRHLQSQQERFACLASIEHNFAKRHRLYAIAMGASNVFVDNRQETLVEQCQRLEVNVLHVSAFQAQQLLATQNIEQLRGIRLKLGGSHVPLALREQLRREIGDNLQAGYGTTETGAIGFTQAGDRDAGESVGQPLPGIEIRTVDGERKPLKQGATGELAIRCAGMFRGYLDNPDASAETLQDGWFYTGDIGRIDEQQRIHLCGRADDMFVFNSMNIYPQEIESQLCEHSQITDAVVLPKPSASHGDIPVALVVAAESGLDLNEIKRFARRKLGVRAPRQITVVSEIPRNASGKVARKVAGDLSLKGDDIRQFLLDVLAESDATGSLSKSQLSGFAAGESDILIYKLDLDSLARMDLLVALETEYQVVISPQTFIEFTTLGEVAAYALSAPKEIFVPTADVEQGKSNLTGVAQLLQRTLRISATVAHFNKALDSLEDRLTPLEIEILAEPELQAQLFSREQNAYRMAFLQWMESISEQMQYAGKSRAEPFVSRRLRSTVTHFVGTGDAGSKILLICYAAKGIRRLLIPNAVLLQHLDASKYDVLMVADPLATSFRERVPCLGNGTPEIVETVLSLPAVSTYQHFQTFGCSAGCYPAILTAYKLNANACVSVGGRIQKLRHLRESVVMLKVLRRASRGAKVQNLVMAFGASKLRDRFFARLITALFGGRRISVKLSHKRSGHRVLQDIPKRGALGEFLANTLSNADEQPRGSSTFKVD